jgi:hypothetical protein
MPVELTQQLAADIVHGELEQIVVRRLADPAAPELRREGRIRPKATCADAPTVVHGPAALDRAGILDEPEAGWTAAPQLLLAEPLQLRQVRGARRGAAVAGAEAVLHLELELAASRPG